MSNQTLIFKKVPAGVVPVPGEHLVVEGRPFDIKSAPPPGGVVLRTNYASFDPFLRVKMCSADNASLEPFEIDGPIDNSTISTVIKSDTPSYQPGDIVAAYVPIAEYNVLTNDKLNLIEGKVDNPFGLDLGLFLGPLGMPGLTAYSSLYEVGEPEMGQTLFVTSAAGAVGQLVGQLAKREGLKVIGSVGSDDKLAFITKELGFDGGFNYKKEKTFEALQRLAPEGIDIFYDNVGGEQFEATLLHMKTLGRVVISGAVSQYNLEMHQRYGIRTIPEIDARCLRVQGFLVWHFADKYKKLHQENVQKWLADGSLVAKIHEDVGIDAAAEGLAGMLKGNNFGKAILKIH